MNGYLPFLGVFLTALVSVGVAILAYHRSKKTDAVAEQAGIRSDTSTSIEQVVTGLNSLVQALQVDNVSLREIIRELRGEVIGLRQEIVNLRQELIDGRS